MKKIFSIFVLSVSFVLFSSEVDADEITSMPNVLEHLELDDFSPLIEDSNLLYVYKNDSKTKELFNSFKKIENEQQLIQDVFKGYATNYQDYPHKARIPDSNRILISLCGVPHWLDSFLEIDRCKCSGLSTGSGRSKTRPTI